MVKVVVRPGLSTVACLTLRERPLHFARVSDGLVALTTFSNVMYLLYVSGHVTVRSRFHTARQYVGVADGAGDDTLFVSCWKDGHGPACVDVIRRDGEVVRRIAVDKTPTILERPLAICVMDGHVMITDLDHDCVYRVKVTTGRLVDTLTHPDLKKPCQVVVDDQGNRYMASRDGQCVLVLTAGGQWRRLLHGPQHGDKDFVYPVRLCLTKSGMAVVWRNESSGRRVIVYKLA